MKTPYDQFWQCVLSKKNELPDQLREEISAAGPVNTLVHLFNQYNGASVMNRCFLLLFPFWKDFSLEEWQSVFQQVTDQQAGHYYLSYNFKSLLGIDSAFAKQPRKTPAPLHSPDLRMVSGLAVFELNEPMRKRYEEQLASYGITLDVLKTISDRLMKENAESTRGIFPEK